MAPWKLIPLGWRIWDRDWEEGTPAAEAGTPAV
jgi:hypothetical protein